MTENQFLKITAWQRKTFSKATAFSKLCHLEEEISELKNDLFNSNPNRRLEWADNFLLLFGAASADGMTYQDICNAIDEKMVINEKREWGIPDENGVVKHINNPTS